jgi:hypothetical protein
MQRQMQTASDEGGRCVQAGGGKQAGREMERERERGQRLEVREAEVRESKQRPRSEARGAARQTGQTDRQTAKQPEGLHGEGLGG